MDSDGICWLASFPKSGNTWLRLFIDAYHHDRAPNINSLFGTVTDQAMRHYQACSAETVADMPPEERVLLHTAAMMQLAGSLPYKPKLVKTHNANVTVSKTRLIHPMLTKRVVYLVRDPRDVAVSYSKHFGLSLDETVKRMTIDRVALYAPSDTTKMHHWTCSWARHVASYAESDDLDVTVVKYEDMLTDPVKSFTWLLKWVGVPVDEDRVTRAVENCHIAKMRRQEEEKGFKEASEHTDRFFGRGAAGSWNDLLSREQVEVIEAHASGVMGAFGYQLASKVAA